MYDAGQPWVAVDPKGDWRGVRSSSDGNAPGLAVVVIGGHHGDVPLDPGSGRLVAELIASSRLTGVLDVTKMSKSDSAGSSLTARPGCTGATVSPALFAEEAHEYIPQRVTAGDARMVGAWENLIKRGGTHGLGVTLITQRTASLNKEP